MVLVAVISQSCSKASASSERRYDFPNIFDISYTPDTLHRHYGLFTDAGSWIGFTPPEKDKWINGFCGPYSIDMNRREWLAKCAVTVSGMDSGISLKDSVCYYPGELVISSEYKNGAITQRLNFIDANTMLLTIDNSLPGGLAFTGDGWAAEMKLSQTGNSVISVHPTGETVVITFPQNVKLNVDNGNYQANAPHQNRSYVSVAFFCSPEEAYAGLNKSVDVLENPLSALESNKLRWEGYLTSTLRDDMPAEYDRIAVKAMTTLASNHRAARGGLLHDGIIPSHAVGYFVGLWAWDSWRFCAGAASFDPELAKNNIRAMFDYQSPMA